MKPILLLLLSAGALLANQLGDFINPTASFTRPTDTTAYASGDLVGNSVTAGSVVAPVFTVGRSASAFGQQFRIDRIKIRKSTTTTTNASFRVHLYKTAPTIASGDNAAFSTSGAADDLGYFDVVVDQAFTDGATGFVIGGPKAVVIDTAATIVCLLEARAAYAPGNAEIFTVALEVVQNNQ
jgi:hypothetical protein